MAGSTGVSVASDRIGIVLADDHALIRSGLRRVLERQSDLTVVGEAGDVETALNPELPPGLQDVLDRALAKDPGDRPSSASDLARDAAAAIALEPPPARS